MRVELQIPPSPMLNFKDGKKKLRLEWEFFKIYKNLIHSILLGSIYFRSFPPHHHHHPIRNIQMDQLIFVRRIGDGLVKSFEASVDFFIGIDENMVGSCLGHMNRKTKKGLGRMEGKHKNQSPTGIG